MICITLRTEGVYEKAKRKICVDGDRRNKRTDSYPERSLRGFRDTAGRSAADTHR